MSAQGRAERQPRGKVAQGPTSGSTGRGTSVATTGRVAQTYPCDHYKLGGAFMDYRMGYRDVVTGVLYTTRYGNIIAVPSEEMPPLVRRR